MKLSGVLVGVNYDVTDGYWLDASLRRPYHTPVVVYEKIKRNWAQRLRALTMSWRWRILPGHWLLM